MAHTKGPWKAYHSVGAGWSVKMAEPRDGYDRPDPICSMAWWQFDIPGIIDNEISEANARLIAAAPELLVCLKAIYRDGVDDYWAANNHEIMERTKAAINQATAVREGEV